MSKLLLDVRTPHLHTSAVPSLIGADSSLPFADRLSLRLGLWLLLRGARRAERRADHAGHRARLAHERARTAREASALRLHQLGPRL